MNFALKASVLGVSFLFTAFVSPSCISIPERPYVLSHREGAEPAGNTVQCVEEPPGTFSSEGDARGAGIDPDGFTLFSWNTKKGSRAGWDEDLTRLAAGADLLILQEAWLTEDLLRLLEERWHHWDMTAAFLSGNRETGVLTGSQAPPDYVCGARHAEPLVFIPKTFLVSRYLLSGTDETLLVANVHLINFSIETAEYREQLRLLETILASHEGPLLLAGDFNTWSSGRAAAVHDLARRLSLEEVGFGAGDLASFFGRPVDHVFYRGLQALEARAVSVSSSDHNPLLVTFRLPARGVPR